MVPYWCDLRSWYNVTKRRTSKVLRVSRIENHISRLYPILFLSALFSRSKWIIFVDRSPKRARRKPFKENVIHCMVLRMSLNYVCLLCRVESNSFYAPTLHQFKIELEDALIENDRPAYYRYSESEFSGFSWLGYVVFSQSQVMVNFTSL